MNLAPFQFNMGLSVVVMISRFIRTPATYISSAKVKLETTSVNRVMTAGREGARIT